VKAGILWVALLLVLLAGCGSESDDEAAAPPTPGPPTEPLSQAVTYRVKVETNRGDFTITLDQKTSPKAAASFVALAEAGFFDDTNFHRIVPGFVIQGGDPGGTGTGGPGYQTVDTPAADTKYTQGTVAMAKSASDPRGAAGSQFFVMTADAPNLPPDYAVIGEVTDGLDVVLRIGALGGPDELPTQDVVVERMTVSEE
jgi:peptidyl-prolyl cis-trans isomerase B (cyclophilin B)